MLEPLNIIPLLLIGLICYSVYHAIQKRNKFRTAIYDISLYSSDAPKYHLVIEMKHGQYVDTRKLSVIDFLFIPNNIIPLLKSTYSNYDSAHNSLQELKKKYI